MEKILIYQSIRNPEYFVKLLV